MIKIDKAYIVRHIVRYANRQQQKERHWYIYKDCVNLFKKRLELNGFNVDEPVEGEEEYVKFWQQFCDRVEPYSYRYFSRICGPSKKIVPEDVACVYIETLLNPERYRAMYSDKNMYARLMLPYGVAPKTLVYRIASGNIYAGDSCSNRDVCIPFLTSSVAFCNFIPESYKKIVLKPSIDSHSGAGVMLFERQADGYRHSSGTFLSGKYLMTYGGDFVIQEVLVQDPFLSQFCATSVNTIRVMTYRSISDDSVSILGAVLRIGHNGSFVDNLFAGGGFTPIDLDTGELGKFVLDQFGRKYTEINGIDFQNQTFIIPYWKETVRFAKSIASQIRHARLCALDVIFDINGKPRLIEYNVDRFMWSFIMFGGRLPFDDKFDEVIDYCLKHKKEIYK